MINRSFCKTFLNTIMFYYSSKSNQTRQTVPINNRFRKRILEMCCDESCRVYKLVSYYAIYNRKLQMCIIVRKRFLYFVLLPSTYYYEHNETTLYSKDRRNFYNTNITFFNSDIVISTDIRFITDDFDLKLNLSPQTLRSLFYIVFTLPALQNNY